MQKEAWTFSLAGTVLGAFGLLLRWLQCQIIFDESGLPAKNSPASWVMVIYLIAAAAALWWLSGRTTPQEPPVEPEQAFSRSNRDTGIFLAIGALAAGLGAAYMFLKGNDTLFRITALLGILSAPALALYPSLPRWGGFGAGLSLVPVVFFSLWLVIFYRINAVNPVMWKYAMEILAIAGCLLGAYRACGYLFYRASPRQGIFGCAMAVTLSLVVLMDDISLGERVMFAGWAIGFGVLSWILVRSFETVPEEETPGKEE